MDSTHWIKYAHAKLREIGVPCSDLVFNYSHENNNIQLDREGYDEVNLISVLDFSRDGDVSNKKTHTITETEIKRCNNLVEKLGEKGAYYAEDGWKQEIKSPLFSIALSFNRCIVSFTQKQQQNPESYRAFNLISAELDRFKDGTRLEYWCWVGEDFGRYDLPIAWGMGHQTLEDGLFDILRTNEVLSRAAEFRCTSKREIERRLSQLSPAEYLDRLFCKHIAGLYSQSLVKGNEGTMIGAILSDYLLLCGAKLN